MARRLMGSGRGWSSGRLHLACDSGAVVHRRVVRCLAVVARAFTHSGGDAPFVPIPGPG